MFYGEYNFMKLAKLKKSHLIQLLERHHNLLFSQEIAPLLQEKELDDFLFTQEKKNRPLDRTVLTRQVNSILQLLPKRYNIHVMSHNFNHTFLSSYTPNQPKNG